MSEIPEQIYDVPPKEFDKLVEILKNSDKVIIRNLKVFWEEHELVHCTADGEFPEDDITVLAEFHGKDFSDTQHLVWFEWDNAQWVDFLTEEIIPNVPEEMKVYWKPLTSLKAQYELEQERRKNEQIK